MSDPIFHEAIDFAAVDLTWATNLSILKVTFLEPETWVFDLGGKMGISAECLWRIVAKQGIVRTSDDHGQFFSRKIPIDAASEVSELLKSVSIKRIEIIPITFDLTVYLEDDIKLQIIPISSGYESWHIYTPTKRGYGANGAGLFTYLEK